MTNAEIIMNAQMELMENGIIKGTGRMVEAVITDADGNETRQMVEEPEAIHTFQVWKQLGYQVKKGQKAKATFSIWKYVKPKKKEENQEEPEAKMFMTKASFFTIDQTEKIA
jgi:hypothetical protein